MKWCCLIFLLFATTVCASIPKESSWRATLDLTPGSHQLRVEAAHPSGLYTGHATNGFTNSTAGETISDTHDASGNVTSRIWKTGSTTNRTQTFVWDGRGRLLKTIERDSNQNGFDEIAVYDPLGRRLRLTNIPYTNTVAISNSIVTLDSIYDPEVEFLELGVAKNGDTVWKLYGPDLNGVYGGLNGLGGFEAIIPAAELFCPVIGDALGNLHGIYDQGHAVFDWFASRVTAFGAVPGYRPVPYAESTRLSLAHASAYRGKQGDANGTIALGARNLLWDAGVFLSTDPAGHGSPNENLYTAFNGRIDLFDPTGWGVTPSLGFLDRFPDAESLEREIAYIHALGQAQGLARQAHNEWLAARNYREISTAIGYESVWDYMVAAGQQASNNSGNRGFTVTHDGWLSGAFNGIAAWVNEAYVNLGNAANRAAGSVQSIFDPVGGAGTASVQDSPTFSSFHRAYRAGSASFQSGYGIGYAAAPYAVDAGLAFGTGGLWAEARALTTARNLARAELAFAGSAGVTFPARSVATLPADIAASFRGGEYSSRVLQSDVVAYRFSGGVSEPAGRFLTTHQTVRWIGTPGEAIRALNLPSGATAEQLNAFIIPRGTEIFYGRIAGGAQRGTQIFIRDRSVLVPAP